VCCGLEFKVWRKARRFGSFKPSHRVFGCSLLLLNREFIHLHTQLLKAPSLLSREAHRSERCSVRPQRCASLRRQCSCPGTKQHLLATTDSNLGASRPQPGLGRPLLPGLCLCWAFWARPAAPGDVQKHSKPHGRRAGA